MCQNDIVLFPPKICKVEDSYFADYDRTRETTLNILSYTINKKTYNDIYLYIHDL